MDKDPLLCAQLQDMFPSISSHVIDQVVTKFQDPERITEELLNMNEISHIPILDQTISSPSAIDPQSCKAEPEVEESELPNEVLRFRQNALKELVAVQAATTEGNGGFKVTYLNPDDESWSRLKDKAKLFFSMFSGCTVEVNSIRKITSNHACVKFWSKASSVDSLAKIIELCKPVPLLPPTLTGLLQITERLTVESLYALNNYAPTNHCPGDYTLIVCDVLLGEKISTDEPEQDEDATSFPVAFSSQLLVKFLLDITTKRGPGRRRAARYTDVPEVLWDRPEGRVTFRLSAVDLRNVSDPFNVLLQEAKSQYDGACLQRANCVQGHRGNAPVHKRPIRNIEIVICPRIWEQYERQKRQMAGTGAYEIYAYHATDAKNVEAICRDNLDWKRPATHGRAYGHGCYFSEYPEVSAHYNNSCIFIFKLILMPNCFTKVEQNQNGFCKIIVISDTTLFKPVYVLYF